MIGRLRRGRGRGPGRDGGRGAEPAGPERGRDSSSDGRPDIRSDGSPDGWSDAGPDVAGCLQRETARALPVVCAGLAVLYAVYLGGALLATSRGRDPLAPGDSVLTGAVVAVMAALAVLSLRYRRRMGAAVHAAAGITGLVALSLCLLRAATDPDPLQSVNLLLFLMALGVFLLSVRWYVVLVALAWTGWTAIGLGRAGSADAVLGYAMVTATLLSAVAFTARRRMVVRLEHARARHERAALVDALTGVHNRRGLEAAAPGLLRRAGGPGGDQGREGRGEVTALVVDIDDMKGINDTWGHAAGDAAVLGAARVLCRAVRRTDVVARTGGDEFVVLVEGGCAATVADRVRHELDRHAGEVDHPFRLQLSVGAVTLPADAGLQALLSAADVAMYRTKARRRTARGRDALVDAAADI